MSKFLFAIAVGVVSLAASAFGAAPANTWNDKLDSTARTTENSAIVRDAFIDGNRIFSYTTNVGVFARDFVGELNLGWGGMVFPYAGLENLQNGLAKQGPDFCRRYLAGSG